MRPTVKKALNCTPRIRFPKKFANGIAKGVMETAVSTQSPGWFSGVRRRGGDPHETFAKIMPVWTGVPRNETDHLNLDAPEAMEKRRRAHFEYKRP